MNLSWSRTCPSKPLARANHFVRLILPWERSASRIGSRSPSMMARRTARPVVPVTSLITDASLMLQLLQLLQRSRTFLKPLLLFDSLPDELPTRSGQVSEVLHQLVGDKTRSNETMRRQVGEPLSIAHGALSPGHVLDLLSHSRA